MRQRAAFLENFEILGDKIKCRLEILSETTNWDTRRNGMKGGIVRDYFAYSKGWKWLGANLNGILVFWIMTSCRWVTNYQSFGEVSCLHFQGSSSPKEDKTVFVFDMLMDIRVS